MATTSVGIPAGTAFTIRELEGQQRLIELNGRGLPHRPISFPTSQRLEDTWLPGSPEATQTILGSKVDPTTINGFWHDVFIDVSSQSHANVPPIQLDGSPVYSVGSAVQLFESLTSQAALLEVTWGQTKRHGRLAKFTPTWHNLHDVEWACEFNWISNGDPVGGVAFINRNSLGDAAASARQALQELEAVEPLFPANPGILGQLQAISRAIDDAITNVEDAIQNVVYSVTWPVSVVKGIIAQLQTVESECQLMADFCVSEVAGTFRSDAPVENQSAADKLEAQAFVIETKERAKALQRLAVEARTSIQADYSSNVLAVYTARQGDDLRDVARQFYGSPYEWRRIQLYNDLDSTSLAAGQKIDVPKLNVASDVGGSS